MLNPSQFLSSKGLTTHYIPMNKAKIIGLINEYVTHLKPITSPSQSHTIQEIRNDLIRLEKEKKMLLKQNKKLNKLNEALNGKINKIKRCLK